MTNIQQMTRIVPSKCSGLSCRDAGDSAKKTQITNLLEILRTDDIIDSSANALGKIILKVLEMDYDHIRNHYLSNLFLSGILA